MRQSRNVPGRVRPRAAEGQGAVAGEALPLLAAVVQLHPADLFADEIAVVSVEVDGLAHPVRGGLDEDAREPGRHEVDGPHGCLPTEAAEAPPHSGGGRRRRRWRSRRGRVLDIGLVQPRNSSRWGARTSGGAGGQKRRTSGLLHTVSWWTSSPVETSTTQTPASPWPSFPASPRVDVAHLLGAQAVGAKAEGPSICSWHRPMKRAAA